LSWPLESIRSARDQQMLGVFEQPVKLAEAMRTDDALFTAYQTRVATQLAIRLDWRSVATPAGRAALDKLRPLVRTPHHVRESIHGTLVNHGIAVGYVHQDVRDTDAGPEVCYTLTEWPLEHVRFRPNDGTLTTRTKDGIAPIVITHGDGRWIVFKKFGVAPWTQDAAILPSALLWAMHSDAMTDWAAASYSHGQVKLLGVMPEGVTGAQEDGTLSPQMQSMLDTLAGLASGDSPAGALPFGSIATLLTNGSTAWQVFDKLIINREKAALRVYCGTDATLGSQGGAPGVDVASLFGIATTRIQGDFEALERGFREGLIEPWCRAHGVAIADAPALVYEMPDTDGDARAAQEATAIERLGLAIQALKGAQLAVGQDVIDALSKVLSVSVPCVLAARESAETPLQLAPTDVAKVVTVNEARASQGLAPLPDERGSLFVAELEAQQKAAAAPAQVPEAAPDTPPAEPDDPPTEALNTRTAIEYLASVDADALARALEGVARD
jgi:hypothetical protein